MKKILFCILCAVLFAGLCFAGEREELVFEQKYLEEKITRIRFQQQLLEQAEQEALKRHQEIINKLDILFKPEIQPQPKVEKKKEAPSK